MKAILRKTIASDACFNDGDAELPATQELLPTGKTVHLRGRQHLRICHADGWTVSALSGAVWLTQDGDIRDIVLQAGDSFVLDRSAPALLSPLGDARLRVTRTPDSMVAPASSVVRPSFA